MRERSQARPEAGNDGLQRWKLIYDRILDISADGFLVVDEKANILDINRAYCAFLGIRREDAIGKYVMEVIKNSRLPEILKTGEMEVNVVHKLAKGQTPGNEKYVAVTRAAVKDEDKVIAAVGQIYFAKEMMDLSEKLQNMDIELNYYKNELSRVARKRYSFDNIIGRGKLFLEVKKIAQKAAKNDFAVLILGETGTGKEVFANAIHYASKRRNKPFIRVNCAAIPSELLESELFGYEEGAFTGAKRGGKKGKFELASGGTIFLDEIGEMPQSMQVKILRVLQEKEVERIGGYKTIPTDVRVIAATNRDPKALGGSALRNDLYYRLNVIQLKIPPLRERREDIRAFIHHVLRGLNEEYSRRVALSPEVFSLLEEYDWPGNVRELINVLESAYSLVDGQVILASNLPHHIRHRAERSHREPARSRPLSRTIDDIEKEVLLNVLKRKKFNCRATAKELGIHRSTLYRKFEKFRIRRDGEEIFNL
ncbi:MAG TPA: sigma 54-interacting transcriptional regulator [Syntrophales bacterium]|nr:sigma 54-interacting transcriptional regulator [Syntrophales bacterium]